MIVTRTLTVEELIRELKGKNPKAKVGLSIDSEGNGFSLIGEREFISSKVYMKDRLDRQETYFTDKEYARAEKELIDPITNEKVDKEDLTECIILWPSL